MANLIDLIQAYRQQMTGEISRSLAQLYSAHIRLAWESRSLPTTLEQDRERLSDAVKLIDTAFFEKEHGIDPKLWQASLRRAAEILEWLSHPQMKLSTIPTQLLAAAAYQLAGYPARASGLLQQSPAEADSSLWRAFLQAQFPLLLAELVAQWAEFPTDQVEYAPVDTEALANDPDAFSRRMSDLVVSSILSALGVIAAQMRWGDEDRVEKALAKLRAVAKLLLHSDDFYSWLLAELCAGVSETYTATALRHALKDLDLMQEGQRVVERYLRLAYRDNKTLAWPSQLCGIERLRGQTSFALCTPTGSGKTTVAEIAILQGLFLRSLSYTLATGPLVLYLVPTRALATEVEFKLSKAFKALRTEETPEVIVTGLYGGADWDPTDAWTTRSNPTILICTYEKAEALLRFMGATLAERLSLVILDEAHRVQFDAKEKDQLEKAENRSLRLETLGMRLFLNVERHNGRVIALSAVAQNIETALASWVSNTPSAEPAKKDYHSTRQLLGRLVCERRQFRIEYDLLDHKRLQLDESLRQVSPFVPHPFPPYPFAPIEWEPPSKKPPTATQMTFLDHPPVSKPEKAKSKSSKYLRPYLFWAAMHLAQHQTVLIAVMEKPAEYAQDFLTLLDAWQNIPNLPDFFKKPETQESLDLWQNCLASCDDYLGQTSNEYRLLQKGVVVHHGKMPAPLARLLIELVDRRVVRLVIATSTLTEGVNLPFETILIPELRRRRKSMDAREVSNLMGRAGRPGHATEGRTLVLTTGRKNVADYITLLATLESKPDTTANPESALQVLLNILYQHWQNISHLQGITAFVAWLEQVSPQDNDFPRSLDTLDDILLTAVVELENQTSGEVKLADLEARLQALWRRSYAYFVAAQQDKWEQAFVQRGRALVTNETNYGDQGERRRLYATTLPPHSGKQLLELYPTLEPILQTGADYADWDRAQQFQYIVGIAAQILTITKFAFDEPGKMYFKRAGWRTILHWWLDPFWGYDDEGILRSEPVAPAPDQAFKWYEYVHRNFIYKLNWGIGSCISIAFSRAFDGERRIPTVDDWPVTGLPWIVYWLEELIKWGTLDPVAAYLLARARSDGIITRPEAERRAQAYYEEHCRLSANERLDPNKIRNWVTGIMSLRPQVPQRRPQRIIPAASLRDFSAAQHRKFRVLPARKDGKILWVDTAGFLLAESERPAEWDPEWIQTQDFYLDYTQQRVRFEPYL